MTIPPALRPLCPHLDGIRKVTAGTVGCAECLGGGGTWVHLRICLACGHVGCCDSSPATHARRHYEETGHPIVAPLDEAEPWAWCYGDRVLLPGDWTPWWRR